MEASELWQASQHVELRVRACVGAGEVRLVQVTVGSVRVRVRSVQVTWQASQHVQLRVRAPVRVGVSREGGREGERIPRSSLSLSLVCVPP